MTNTLIEWDGKDIHYGFSPGQSAQEAETACGLILSTWSGKYGRTGYSFNIDEITCSLCIKWMETNFKRCDCGELAEYSMCRKCAIKWMEEKCCSSCHRLKEHCRCK